MATFMLTDPLTEDTEDCLGRITVGLTRSKSLTIVVSPLDMIGLIGMAQVLATLAYGIKGLRRGISTFFFRPTPLGFRQVVQHVRLHVAEMSELINWRKDGRYSLNWTADHFPRCLFLVCFVWFVLVFVLFFVAFGVVWLFAVFLNGSWRLLDYVQVPYQFTFVSTIPDGGPLYALIS